MQQIKNKMFIEMSNKDKDATISCASVCVANTNTERKLLVKSNMFVQKSNKPQFSRIM